MTWDQLSINKPHLVYIILGGFTSLFMLCSSVVKERLYIGEATVATIVGIIFGPHAANLINPETWGNVDQITLEFSRIVLVVQCFAVGVELPKAYMEKHWRSVVFLLVPVMTFGWLVTSLFIWGLFYSHLSWLDSLVCAACVTATDPVLASSVVGKGKFAKRVPKHLRDLLSAESGCNDGMAFPFIYLGIYLVRYRPDAALVSEHWFLLTILYECIFGAIYGVAVGYAARRAIRYAHEHDLIDRESFLVFYFVLALFCAGSGSILGIDDLLVGFACGVGFSNDGWFLEKTEEAHVSNVIDLLINLAFFVYFGTIIPWNLYASSIIGTAPWRLVVLAILVLLFRRIPIMLLLKPAIPDIKTWREALFAGHFGPIGVGALFVAILARAEFETETTTPLAHPPPPGFPHDNIIELIWPITTFLVITSIIVHGSSVAVFTLGRHINTLTFTMSYTRGNDESNWMDRLPRIQSRSKSSMSIQKGLDSSQEDLEEKLASAYPPAGLPRLLLRRQKEEESSSRASSVRPLSRKKKWDSGIGPGGHVEESAISPKVRRQPSAEKVDSEITAVSSEESPTSENNEKGAATGTVHYRGEPEAEVFEEGENDIVEDEEGNVLSVMQKPQRESEQEKEDRLGEEAIRAVSEEGKEAIASQTEHDVSEQADTGRKRSVVNGVLRKLGNLGDSIKSARASPSQQEEAQAPEEKRRNQLPARAFRFGNTVIVEDEDGEVIKKYNLGERSDRPSYVDRQRIQKWIRGSPADDQKVVESPENRKRTETQISEHEQDEDDRRIRFTMEGRKFSKAEFIQQIQNLDARSRPQVVDEPAEAEQSKPRGRPDTSRKESKAGRPDPPDRYATELRDQSAEEGDGGTIPQRLDSVQIQTSTGADLTRLDSAYDQDIPTHSVSEDVRQHTHGQSETPADRRRRLAAQQQPTSQLEAPAPETAADRRRRYLGKETTLTTQVEKQNEMKSERSSPSDETRGRTSSPARRPSISPAEVNKGKAKTSNNNTDETPAERRRREGALGVSKEDSDSEDESKPRQPPKGAVGADSGAVASAGAASSSNIRFADQTASSNDTRPKFGNVRWGNNRGR